MPVVRHYLGWDRPLCDTVAARLLGDCGAGPLDLRGTIVVAPTRQASWRLRAALPLAAHARGAMLLGPEIVTAPALLRPPPAARAVRQLEALLAWSATIRATPLGAGDAFLGTRRPATEAWALRLARRLIALRVELADGGLTIGDVAARGPALEEADRWAAMAELERCYLAELAVRGLEDTVARQLAYAKDGAPPPHVRCVVAAALPDPPQLLMTLLEQWSGKGVQVEIAIAAPPEEAEAFDSWGRPMPDCWNARDIPIDERDLILCADPEDQARRIAELLRQGGAPSAADQSGQRPAVALGIPDAEVLAPLQRELAAIGISAFDPRNRPFAETPLFRLVDLLLAWQRHPGYSETARLLRHPDVLAGVTDPRAVLVELDRAQAEHLPVTFAALRAAAASHANLAGALARLDRWRTHLASGSPAAGLRATLAEVYSTRLLQTDAPRDLAFRQAVAVLDEALRELAAVEAAGRAGAEAAAAFVARLQDASLKPERAAELLDLEGWLELAWNPAPVIAVAGMNEGIVPDGHVGDIFLPDSLRRDLELRDDRRRVARDTYLLLSLLAPRRARGRTLLLVGKTSLAGDPLRPSRLLFRCADDRLVPRARTLFAQPPSAHAAAPFGVSFMLEPGRIQDARRGQADLLERGISATKFRDYLACPLRFYLRHVLRMEAIDDLAREPDGRAFGSLIHEVLQAMGQSEVWSCGAVDPLARWLEQELRARAAVRYGERPWLGVSVAVESAVQRLRVFAARQVAWQAEGWDIIATESSAYRVLLQNVAVTGQIDRIDRHRHDGRICVLDYKTTEQAKAPGATHTAAGTAADLPEAMIPKALLQTRTDRHWIDLQLPVYRELVRAAHGPDTQVGYVLLPSSLADTAFALWDPYPPELHAHAMACARAVVDRIRAGRFWPPTSRGVPFDDFGALLFDDTMRFARPVATPAQPASTPVAGAVGGREGSA